MITVKARLRGTRVIRRLKVQPDYESLERRLRQIFIVDEDVKMRLNWQDQDNDRVVFSSDEELQDALANDPKFKENGVFRIEVIVKNAYDSLQSSDSESGSESGEESDPDVRSNHPDIICDGCTKPVRGYRFKCVVCPDYDLCVKCEKQKKHCEHDMLLIRRPLGEHHNGRGMANVLHLMNALFTGSIRLEVCHEGSSNAEAASSSCQDDPQPNVATRDSASCLELDVDAMEAEAEATAPVQEPSSTTTEPAEPVNPVAAPEPITHTVPIASSGAAAAAVDSGFVLLNSPLETKVLEARQQMLAMGFDDDGGKLTALLRAKNADIVQVLDAINNGNLN